VKYTLNYALILLLLVSFSNRACAQTNGDQELKKLIKLNDDWSDQFVKKDVDFFTSFFEPNARVGWKLETVGKEEIRKSWTSIFAMPEIQFAWKTKDAQMAKSGDLAYLTSAWTQSWKEKDGTTKNFSGTALAIWRKQADGSWKILMEKP